MSLPQLLVLTDRSRCAGPLPQVVAAAVRHGARGVVLREKDLPDDDRADLAQQLLAALQPVGGVLVAASRPVPGTDAVHLAAGDTFPPPGPSLVGRSCHSREEVARAQAEGCDYVTVSPVFPTPSKPGYGPTLGPAGLAPLLAAGLPAYALGGVQPGDVAACLAGGARGIAVMGPVMRDPSTVAAYLKAVQGVPA